MNACDEPKSLIHRGVPVRISPGEDGWYVGEAAGLPMVTQGRTVNETICNAREALDLHLENEEESQ